MTTALSTVDIEIKQAFDDLLANCTRCNQKGDRTLIRKAFKIALDAQTGPECG